MENGSFDSDYEDEDGRMRLHLTITCNQSTNVSDTVQEAQVLKQVLENTVYGFAVYVRGINTIEAMVIAHVGGYNFNDFLHTLVSGLNNAGFEGHIDIVEECSDLEFTVLLAGFNQCTLYMQV